MKVYSILKKIGIALAAAALLALALFWLLSPYDSEERTDGEYEYKLVGNGFQHLFGAATVRIVNYTGDAEDVEIPSTIAGKPVTQIGGNAFDNDTWIKSVVIPDGVTEIRDNAFHFCKNLTHVTIPDSVTKIGLMAFECCESLTDVAIPGSVKEIGPEAFFYCSKLKTVTFSEGLTKVGFMAFDNTAIEELNLPKSLISIGFDAFERQSLKRITVADGNPIYHSAGNCLIETATKTLVTGCENSTIPADGSVTAIGPSAFMDCEGLTEVVVPEGVTMIDDYAFAYCYGLKKVTLPQSLTTVGIGVLGSCGDDGEVEIHYAGGEAGRAKLTVGINNPELENAKWVY